LPSAYSLPSDRLRWLLNIRTQPSDNNRTLLKDHTRTHKERNNQDTISNRSNNTHRISKFRNSLSCHTRSNHILRTPNSSNNNTRNNHNHNHPMPNSSNSLPCNTRLNNSRKTRAQMRRPLRRRRRIKKSTAVVFGVIGASRTILCVAAASAALDVGWWRVLG
jgi:hypothetical protein